MFGQQLRELRRRKRAGFQGRRMKEPLRRNNAQRSTSHLEVAESGNLDSRGIRYPLGHGAHDQQEETRRHRDRHFRFDG
jgi:hypothetical protein